MPLGGNRGKPNRGVSHCSHPAWKSLRDFHIPTVPNRRGKVENQLQVFHFPTRCFSVFTTTHGLRPLSWCNIGEGPFRRQPVSPMLPV